MLKFLKHHWSKRENFLARWSVLHLIFAVALGAFVATVVALWQVNKDSMRVMDLRQTAQQVQTVSQTPPGTQPIGGAFNLVNQDGKPVKDSDFRGKYMLVYFGYTYCPDMCPTGLQSMAKALDGIGPNANKVAPLFITIDPARDTKEKLKAFVAEFNTKIQGLTGTDQQIAEAAKAYQVYYAKGEQVDEHDYVMDHSSLIYLMDPDGHLVTTFPEDVDGDAIVKVLKDKIGAQKP